MENTLNWDCLVFTIIQAFLGKFPHQKYTSQNAFSFPRKWSLVSDQTSALDAASTALWQHFTHISLKSFARCLYALDRKKNQFSIFVEQLHEMPLFYTKSPKSCFLNN